MVLWLQVTSVFSKRTFTPESSTRDTQPGRPPDPTGAGQEKGSWEEAKEEILPDLRFRGGPWVSPLVPTTRPLDTPRHRSHPSGPGHRREVYRTPHDPDRPSDGLSSGSRTGHRPLHGHFQRPRGSPRGRGVGERPPSLRVHVPSTR